jgi:hypothetical protein
MVNVRMAAKEKVTPAWPIEKLLPNELGRVRGRIDLLALAGIAHRPMLMGLLPM